jgi:HlyD family secretion protein
MKNIKQRFLGITLIMSAVLLLTSCDTKVKKSDAYGNFELDKTFVSAEAMGQILVLNIEEGQTLMAGEVIGQIDTLDLFYQKQQLRSQQQLALVNLPDIAAQLAVQEQQKDNILIQKDRLDKLFKKGAATQKQLDEVNGSLDLVNSQMTAIKVKRQNVQAQVNAIESQLASLNHQISKCIITSPIEGTVLTQLSREGEMASPGKPLFTIASLKDIRLKVYVSGAQLPHIKIGQKVEVLIDDTKEINQKLDGEVVWIADQAEFTPKTVQTKVERVNLVYAVKVKMNNDGSLKAGMPGEVNF